MTDNNLHPLYPADSNTNSKMSLSKQRLRVWLRLLDRNRDIQNQLRSALREEFDMTLPRFDVMATLNWQPGGLRMSALSARLKVSNGNVTGIIESLIREGLVTRTVAPEDKRAAMVRLTERGVAQFQLMAAAHEAWVNEMFDSFDSEQLDQFAGLLEQLQEGSS